MGQLNSTDDRADLSAHLLWLTKYEAGVANRSRTSAASSRNARLEQRASNLIVILLMVATTAVALFDLFLLGAQFPN